MPVTIDAFNVSTTQTHPGGAVGISALVVNHTPRKVRATATLTLQAECDANGIALGYNRLTLLPGQGMWVTVGWNVPADACIGLYEALATLEGKGADATVKSATFTVAL
jgi:hypothetical protein